MKREEIFQKEVLTQKDLAFLFDISEYSAGKLMRQILFKHDRLKIQGRLHIEDYFEYYSITDKQRYLGVTDNVCISDSVDSSNSN